MRERTLPFEVFTLARPSILEFSVPHAFAVNITPEASIKIAFRDKHFHDWFVCKHLPMQVFPGTARLAYVTLGQFMNHAPLIHALGGEVKVEVSLVDIWLLLREEHAHARGILLMNGFGNIFYVRDTHHVLRAVRLIWEHGGWNLSAISVDSRHGWHAGYKVFCRAS